MVGLIRKIVQGRDQPIVYRVFLIANFALLFSINLIPSIYGPFTDDLENSLKLYPLSVKPFEPFQ